MFDNYIFFGRNIAEIVSYRTVGLIYFPTSSSHCFYTAWGKINPEIAYFSLIRLLKGYYRASGQCRFSGHGVEQIGSPCKELA